MSDIQSCQRCRGSGIILVDGTYRACPDCLSPDVSQFPLPSLDDEAAWGYSNANDRQRWAEVLASARDYAAKPQGWLVLYGEAGSGKTTLLRAIAQRMRQHGHSAVLTSCIDCPVESPNASRIWAQSLVNAPILLIDDVGIDPPTYHSQHALLYLIYRRYELRSPTVFAVSVHRRDLRPTLASRLWDARQSVVLLLPETDLRHVHRRTPLFAR